MMENPYDEILAPMMAAIEREERKSVELRARFFEDNETSKHGLADATKIIFDPGAFPSVPPPIDDEDGQKAMTGDELMFENGIDIEDVIVGQIVMLQSMQSRAGEGRLTNDEVIMASEAMASHIALLMELSEGI